MALLYQGSAWDFGKLKTVYEAIERIALEELGLEVYANQIEVISSEQMLDAYSSIGLPTLYRHWSFGKRFARDGELYRKGHQGLAYEIVINSDPCISYIMENNSMTMQAIVLAHAAFGHNHFFKNNHLFRQWTDAKGISDYLIYARDYIARCEDRYGVEAVERILDAGHALQAHGVDRCGRRPQRSLARELVRQRERRNYEEMTWNPLWRTVPGATQPTAESLPDEDEPRPMELPEDNLLYFIEKNSQVLRGWEREILRIVRFLAQYFYPQRQTKLMNEGCATFVHYHIMMRLHQQGSIDDGAFLEFLQSHTSVLRQPGFDHPHYGGFNPYALGFAMMRDIERICREPTDEDRAWFPDIAGCGDPMATLRRIWADYRDESFILQYLSPKVIRDFRMFCLRDEIGVAHFEVRSIHDERGYRDIRTALAREFETAFIDPEIVVVGVDAKRGERLELEHRVHAGQRLDTVNLERTLQYVRVLWGKAVRLTEVDAMTGKEMPYGQTKVS